MEERVEWPPEHAAYAKGYADAVDDRRMDPRRLDPGLTGYAEHRHYVTGYRDGRFNRVFSPRAEDE